MTICHLGTRVLGLDDWAIPLVVKVMFVSHVIRFHYIINDEPNITLKTTGIIGFSEKGRHHLREIYLFAHVFWKPGFRLGFRALLV